MPSASMQVLEWEPVPEPPATIYTFMGLATIPRLRGGSSLRLLPRETWRREQLFGPLPAAQQVLHHAQQQPLR